MTTTTETRPRVAAFIAAALEGWPHTYDGVPIVEVGDDGEWLVAIGHVDKTAFAKACDAYYRADSRQSFDEVYDGAVTLADVAKEAAHRHWRIRNLEEFPHGEFEFVFDVDPEEGGVDVTVWSVD